MWSFVRRFGCTAVAALGLLLWSGNTAGGSLALPPPDNPFAGYSTGGSVPSSASATFVVPTFACTGVQEDLFGVSITWSDTTNGQGQDSVLVNCSGAGAAPKFTTLVIATGNASTNLIVAPGNKLRASISGSATTSSKAQLVDVTTGERVTVVGPAPLVNAAHGASFTVLRNIDPTTPTFSPLTFRAMTVNGVLLTTATSSVAVMTSASSVVQAQPKPITAGTGVIVFKHS